MPKISVIIPVYNTEKYLRECLDSVISQTFKDIEIICVNDGSTDGSLDILNEYANNDSRIKIITKDNGGLSSARNVGLDNISGEYVYFIDSDDYIEPTLFEYAMNIFNNFDIDYFCFGSKAFCEDECIQSLDRMNEYIRVKRDGIFNLDFDIGLKTNIHVWNKIFKTSIIKKHNIKFIEGLLYEDIYFMWYYFFVSTKAYFDNEVYHHYRMRSTSIMEKATSNKTYESGMAHMYNWHELMLEFSKDQELFVKAYDNLSKLLNNYTRRTKEMVPASDKYKVELLKIDYQKELDSIKKNFIEEFSKPLEYSFLEKIFSVKNSRDRKHKVICVFGVKLKVKKNISKKKNVLVHFHIHYPDQVNFFINKFKNINECDWDLVVTYSEENEKSFSKIRKFKNNAHFIKVNNIGYDIYPFIHVLRKFDLNKYDYVMKLHTKNYQDKEPYWHGKGWHWRDILANSLIGSKKIFKKCINHLEYVRCGEVGAAETLVYQGKKSAEDTYLYDEVCEKYNLSNQRGHFIAGSMFIAKANLMKVIRDLPCEETDFAQSKGTGDAATLAHVIERYLGVLVEQQGYIIKGIRG